MGFDQRFSRQEMISTSKPYYVTNQNNQKEDPLTLGKTGIKWNDFDRNESNINQKKRVRKLSKNQKKNKNEPQILINPSIIFGEKLEVEVMKKGGEFKLMEGCIVSVEENIFIKKGTIISSVIPSNKRQDYPIKLQYQEYLISQIFMIFSKVYLKKPIKYFIPSLKPITRYSYLITSTTDNFQWTPTQKFDFTESGITYVSDKWGFYAIVERQPFENINLNRNGGLINSRIHPMVSIRIPKYSIPTDNLCLLQYLDYTKSTIDEMVECYPFELSNIINVSSMISFGFPDIQLKRFMTIKLPLPSWAVQLTENEENNVRGTELMLFCKRKGIWEHMDIKINYTKNSFTFDSKYFGTFILVEPRSNREGKIKYSLSRVEYVNNIIKGMFLVFLYMENKSWYIWVEMVSIQNAASVRQSREESGLVFIQQCAPERIEKTDKKSPSKTRISQIRDCSKIAELSDGMTFIITLEGDVQFKESVFNIPIISKTIQKSIDMVLKKQSPIVLSSLQKSMKLIDSDELELDSFEDFLTNMKKKKSEKPSIINIPENDLIVNSGNYLSIIFYRMMSENYRVLEIEPIKKLGIEEEITEKWKQKEIIKLSRDEKENEDEEKSQNDNEISYGSLNKKFSSSDNSDTLKDFTDVIVDDKIFNAQTAQSIARIELPNPEEVEHTFRASLKITRDTLCFQLPPNQFDIQKSLNDETKSEHLLNYLPTDVQNSDFQFKFFVEPEEMREYMGISKPTIEDINQAKQEKADGLINKYLKDVDLTNLDTKELDRKKKKALKSISSKLGAPISYTDTNITSEVALRDSRKNKMKVSSRVKDRVNSYDLYREPKVLSSRSLQVLSDYVEHGLTLAVHLDIPDSAINELGFDSLAANKTLSEVTFRILQHWKKSVLNENRPRMPKQLIEALRKMNLEKIADLIRYADDNNEELTQDLFEKGPNFKDILEAGYKKSESEIKTKFKAKIVTSDSEK